MINVLAIAPYRIFPTDSGGKKAILALYDGLSSFVNLTVISASNNRIKEQTAFELLQLLGVSKLRYINPFLVAQIGKIIKTRKITHLIIEHPYCGWLGIILKKKWGVQLIVHSHNIEGKRFKTLGKWWAPGLAVYERFVHRAADLSLFITTEDQDYGVTHFKIQREKTLVAPFGIYQSKPPEADERINARKQICDLYNIHAEKHILLFSGAFDYQPNLKGLLFLLEKVLPELDQAGFKYHLLVCGKNVPNSLEKKYNYNIDFTGYVKDISLFYLGADVFVNPVMEGGGIKTKLVDALAYGCTSISTPDGGIGIPPHTVLNKLFISPDPGAATFASTILENIKGEFNQTPDQFFDYFNSYKVGARVSERLEKL